MKSEHLRVLLALCDSDVFWSTEKLFRHFKSSKDPINFGVVEYALRKLADERLIKFNGVWLVDYYAVLRLAHDWEGNPIYSDLLRVCCERLGYPLDRKSRSGLFVLEDVGFAPRRGA